jgi:putative ABC transport system permease protein
MAERQPIERPVLRPADLLRTAALGLRARKLRAVLSGLAVAVGIAAIVSVLGVTGSSESALLAEIDRTGTNMLTVTNGQDVSGQEVELPEQSAAMIGRTAGVQRVAPTAGLSAYSIYRTDKMPGYATSGLGLRGCDQSLLAAAGATLRRGTFLTASAGRYPFAVLGYQAAVALGVAAPGTRIWVAGPGRGAGAWLTVTGILNPVSLAPEIDSSVLVGFPVAATLFGYDGHPSRIYVRTATDQTAQTAALLAPAAWPEHPEQVQVSRPSDALTARIAVQNSGTTLFLGLGAIAVLAGGLGIANVMVISVLERRTEIGLRRSLGSARRHIAAQFLTEAVLLSAAGGLAGAVIGSAVTLGVATARHWAVAISATTIWGGVGVAVGVGAVAGCYPALRAARLSPADALRGT